MTSNPVICPPTMGRGSGRSIVKKDDEAKRDRKGVLLPPPSALLLRIVSLVHKHYVYTKLKRPERISVHIERPTSPPRRSVATRRTVVDPAVVLAVAERLVGVRSRRDVQPLDLTGVADDAIALEYRGGRLCAVIVLDILPDELSA